MIKRWWHYLLLGIFAWMLFMVWRFPATVAYDMVADSFGEQVQLAGISGTVWEGRAQQLQYNKQAIGSPHWELSPWGLLIGRVDGYISLFFIDGYLEAQAVVPLSGGDLLLSNIKGNAPLSLLQQYVSMIPVPLDGELFVKMDELQVDGEGQLKRAEGRVTWSRAAVQMAEKLQFGDIQMTLHTLDDGSIEGEISDSGGPLQIEATLVLGINDEKRIEGKIKPAEAATVALRNAVAMLGKPDSSGYYTINFPF